MRLIIFLILLLNVSAVFAVPEIGVSPDTMQFKWDINDKGKTIQEIAYDNGSLTYVTYYCPIDNPYPFWAMRFTPSAACYLTAGKVYSYSFSGQPSTLCSLFVCSDTGGNPGAKLIQKSYLSSMNGWDTVNLDTLIKFDCDFWIGYQMPPVGIDTLCITLDNQYNYPGRSKTSKDFNTWEIFPSMPGDLMIRALVSDIGGTYDTVRTMMVKNNGDSDLYVSDIIKNDSWIISVTPTNFTVPALNSRDVTITVSRDGLSNGTHYGSVSLLSNDPYKSTYLEPVKFEVITVGVEENANQQIANSKPQLVILQNTIHLSLPFTIGNLRLTIFDLCGRVKEVVYDGMLNAGNYTFTPNLKTTGVYFVTLSTGKTKQTQKLILIK